MKIPAAQPITAAQSRASRFQLGLTQAEVISESGLPGHKLKQFETGRFVPDMPFLQKLAEFYSGKGIDLTDVEEPGDGRAPVAAPAPAPESAPAPKPGSAKLGYVHRPHFYISDDVTPDLLDQCLERMNANDDRINEILSKGLSEGFFGGFTEQTLQEHQELFGAMAECYLIFRLLQGKPLVQPSGNSAAPKTHADLLGQFYAKSPVVVLDQIEQLSDEMAEEIVK